MQSQKGYYLKSTVYVEPLVNSWYAWSFLISPVTCAMVIANHHVKIMKSYIEAPHIHREALKNKEMRGGPFVESELDINSVKSLLDITERNCAHMIDLSKSIKQLSDMLLQQADGHSLEALYKEVPQELKGYVELVYDLNGHPSFRLIEELLYNSIYFIENLQSIILFTLDDNLQRIFSMSTPRISKPSQLKINLPFKNKLYDKIFSCREIPIGPSELESLSDQLLGKQSIEKEFFYTMFTECPPNKKSRSKLTSQQINIRYLGHACLLIESNECSIIIDPIISYQSNNNQYTYADLPDNIDYLVITHAHQDHVLLEHLLQLRYKVKTVIVPKNNGGGLQDPSLRLCFKYIGYDNVVEIDDMESISIPGGSITGIPFLGEHADLNIQTKKAHLIKVKEKSILCAADSNNIEPKMYEHIYRVIGNIDILFVGMECQGAPMSWVYGPLLTKKITRSMDQSRRLNGSSSDKAFSLVKQFNCSQVYVYAMGLEPWFNYILNIQYDESSIQLLEAQKLVAKCKELGVVAEIMFAIKEIVI